MTVKMHVVVVMCQHLRAAASSLLARPGGLNGGVDGRPAGVDVHSAAAARSSSTSVADSVVSTTSSSGDAQVSHVRLTVDHFSCHFHTL